MKPTLLLPGEYSYTPFSTLDALIRAGLGNVPQDRITAIQYRAVAEGKPVQLTEIQRKHWALGFADKPFIRVTGVVKAKDAVVYRRVRKGQRDSTMWPTRGKFKQKRGR